MTNPHLTEQLEVLRRIAERGLRTAQRMDQTSQLDIWQHMLDEIQRTRRAVEPSTVQGCPACHGVGTKRSSAYLEGHATCMLCQGSGKVTQRDDGTYRPASKSLAVRSE